MRTPILAVALGLSLVGCVIGDATPGEGDDDGTGSTGGPTGGPGTTPMPRVNIAVDKSAVASAIGKNEVITLTLTSVDGFTGGVTVAASLVDGAGAPLTGGITLTGGEAPVSLTANGSATSAYTVKIPTNATGTDMTGTLKFDVTSSAGAKQATSALSIAAVYTVVYAAGLGADVATHPDRALNINVKKGAKLEFQNADTVVHITHGDGAFPHETQGATGGLPNKTYEVTTAALNVGATGALGCHSHGTGTYAKFTVE